MATHSGVEEVELTNKSGGQWNARPDDAVGAEHAAFEVGDVHRAAFALAGARRLAEKLRHHAVHIDALRDAVAVTAVVRVDDVAVVEVLADADRDGFLSGIKMEEACKFPGGHEIDQPLLEPANRSHLAIAVD